MRALIALALLAGVAHADDSLVGHWRVVGCETSPKDPADCGRGEIVFTADRVTVDIPAADRVTRPYRIVKRTKDRVVIHVDDADSELIFRANGEASWMPPGVGGRVGRVSFVRR